MSPRPCTSCCSDPRSHHRPEPLEITPVLTEPSWVQPPSIEPAPPEQVSIQELLFGSQVVAPEQESSSVPPQPGAWSAAPLIDFPKDVRRPMTPPGAARSQRNQLLGRPLPFSQCPARSRSGLDPEHRSRRFPLCGVGRSGALRSHNTMPSTSSRPPSTLPCTAAITQPRQSLPVSLIPADQIVPPPAEGSVVAHIQIPAIRVDQYVVSGTSENEPSEGPGHYTGTAMPGQAGNIAIAGHRTTHGAPFNRLGHRRLVTTSS